MAIAFVQSRSTDTNAVSSLGLAFTSSVTAGNFLVCMGRWGNSGAGAGTITVADSLGQSYTAAFTPVDDTASGGDQAFMFYFPNTAGGANTVTVTVTGDGSHRITMCIVEFSGVATSTPADGTTTNSGAAATSGGTGNLVTTGSSDLILFVLETANTETSGWTGFGSWTQLEGASFGGTNRCTGGYQINVAAGTYSATLSWTTIASNFAAGAAGFKVGAGETITLDKWYQPFSERLREKDEVVGY